MDTINPQILPSSRSRKEHHHAAIVGIWIVIVAALVGAIYWMKTARTIEIPAQSVSDPIKAAQLEVISARTAQALTPEEAKAKENLLKTINR